MKKILLLVTAAIVLAFAPVSAHAITIDGDFSDWTVPVLGTDATGDVPSGRDWKNLWVTHSASDLYFSWEDQNSSAISGTDYILLDTDKNKTTGFDWYGAGKVGVEYMIQGANLFQYTGTGGGWGWTNIGMIGYSPIDGNPHSRFEFSMLQSSIGSPTSFNIALQSDAGGGGSGDWLDPVTYSIPEPTSMLLLGSGLVGLIGFARKKK